MKQQLPGPTVSLQQGPSPTAAPPPNAQSLINSQQHPPAETLVSQTQQPVNPIILIQIAVPQQNQNPDPVPVSAQSHTLQQFPTILPTGITTTTNPGPVPQPTPASSVASG